MSLKQRIRAVLYGLKREYGGRIDVYKQGSVTTDPETGIRSQSSTVTVVRRAIMLPVDIARQEVRGISLISANKSLVQGGWFTDEKQTFIIDKRDAPQLTLSTTDWILLEQQRCSIEKIEKLPCDTGWIIYAKALLGDTE